MYVTPVQSLSLTAYNRGSKNYIDPHSLTSVIAFSFKGMKMLATQLLEEIDFLSSSCTKKLVWVKLTRQIRISVLEIGNHIIHQ